jgi:hypothetical protein
MAKQSTRQVTVTTDPTTQQDQADLSRVGKLKDEDGNWIDVKITRDATTGAITLVEVT